MTNFNIEQITGTAIVVKPGKIYSNYKDFAVAAGHPGAYYEGKYSAHVPYGARVVLHAKGDHGTHLSAGKIYVVSDDEGNKVMIGAGGLDNIYEASRERKTSSPFTNLQAQIDELKAEVAELKRGSTVHIDGKEIAKTIEPPPQLTRTEVVAQAKADVKSMRDRLGHYLVLDPQEPTSPFVCREEFIVNKEKRTVVVLLRGYNSGTIRARGIAKCAPDDCFNADIGKAIAFHRALGLDVPAEYLNAPQPDGVRVGDVVQHRNFPSSVKTVVHVGSLSNFKTQCETRSYHAIKGRVIDDSARVYQVEEGAE